MSDPLRYDEQRPLDPASEADRAAKIEQLLLAGLDHYFASEYDQAINVWTRALFLDRAHARARAYIDRARSAQAERQRESEELLQRGVHAFNQGEAVEARRLLRDAMDQGAPPEEALIILDRLNRLEQVAPASTPPAVPHRLQPSALLAQTPSISRLSWAVFAVLALVIVSSAAMATGVFRAAVPPVPDRGPALAGVRSGQEELPRAPRRAEIALTRAQALARSGRLREALAPLALVRVTDRERAEADRLRAQIQKQLIALAQGLDSAPVVPPAVEP
jgi:tetratricopeptide (TPR) repeat protein